MWKWKIEFVLDVEHLKRSKEGILRADVHRDGEAQGLSIIGILLKNRERNGTSSLRKTGSRQNKVTNLFYIFYNVMKKLMYALKNPRTRRSFRKFIHFMCGKSRMDEFEPMRNTTIYKRDIHDDKSVLWWKRYKVVTFTSGNEIGIWVSDRRDCFISKKHFNKIVRNYIWLWIKDFFWLRTRLYWYSINRHIKRYEKKQ